MRARWLKPSTSGRPDYYQARTVDERSQEKLGESSEQKAKGLQGNGISQPDGWSRVFLGEVSEIVSGVTLGRNTANKVTRKVPYLRVANVKDGHLDLSDVFETDATETEIQKLALRTGDILLTEGGDPDKLGRGTFWREEIPECIHQNHIFRVRLNADHFLPEFASYEIASPYGKSYFLKHAKQTTGIATINQRVLKGFPLLAPPLSRQRQIVEVLDRQMAAVEKARAAAEARLEAAKALPGAYLRVAFDDADTQNWPIYSLGGVGEVVAGITLGRKLKHKQTRKVPYLRVANVKDGFLDLSDVKETQATEEEIQRLRLRRGDLLLTEGGDPDKLGRGTFWKEQIPECIHQNHIFRVRFSPDRFLPDFVAAQISSAYGKAYFLRHAKQTTGIATINQRVLKAFPLKTPTVAEQEALIESLSQELSISQRIHASIDEQLTAINLLPSSLLRKAFNGEL